MVASVAAASLVVALACAAGAASRARRSPVAAIVAAGAVAVQANAPAPTPGAAPATAAVITTRPSDGSNVDGRAADVANGGAAVSGGTGVDPEIDRGSRGVARNLLLAGVAAAAVIAVLSGVFALRHKKH